VISFSLGPFGPKLFSVGCGVTLLVLTQALHTLALLLLFILFLDLKFIKIQKYSVLKNVHVSNIIYICKIFKFQKKIIFGFSYFKMINLE
jgi:hypothetical protein